MQEITISPILLNKVPNLQLSCIECNVNIEEKNESLWYDIQLKIDQLSDSLSINDISQLLPINASRDAYRKCGKAPARYRLSAEALLRRVLKQKDLYQINNVVDIINMVSISTYFSIGGYDADKINGNVEFGIGKKDEPYEGIGRGALNIENLPVFRDDSGAFGSPTSDSQRTSITIETKRILMIIIDFDGLDDSLDAATKLSVDLLVNYANADNFAKQIVK